MSDVKKRRVTFPAENAQELADDLAKGLLFNEATADIILKVQDEPLPAHRAVLAARSEYFRAMLYGGMQESTSKEVQINDNFSPVVMRLLLRYIYTQKLDAAALEDAVPLMACADHYGMGKLRDAMQCQVADAISKETVFSILALAAEHHQEQLIERCVQFTHTSVADIFKSDLFLQLDGSMLLRILEADEVQEDPVHYFRAVERWYRHWSSRLDEGGEAAEQAARHLGPDGCSVVRQLFASIRYGKMAAHELQGEVRALVCQMVVPPDVYADALDDYVRACEDDAVSLWKCKEIQVNWDQPVNIVATGSRFGTRYRGIVMTPRCCTRFTIRRLAGQYLPELAVINKRGKKLMGWCSRWRAGFMLDATIDTVADGYQAVSFNELKPDGSYAELLYERCKASPHLQFALQLRNREDEVTIECVA